MNRLIIVTKKPNIFEPVLTKHKLEYKIFNNKKDLEDFTSELNGNDILLSYNHNIIFSNSILCKIKIGYNIHAASPEFPGRDPHHWAIYNGAREYGAVVHIIEQKVDSGGIIEVVLFDVKPEFSPQKLLKKANIEAEKLITKLIEIIAKKEEIKVNNELKWGKEKKSRKDFIDICFIPPTIPMVELERRIKAFHIEGRNNLYTKIEGRKFYFL